ncbi:hypothetical protein DSECCO2_504480 [anaerobic digester metagenome]
MDKKAPKIQEKAILARMLSSKWLPCISVKTIDVVVTKNNMAAGNLATVDFKFADVVFIKFFILLM